MRRIVRYTVLTLTMVIAIVNITITIYNQSSSETLSVRRLISSKGSGTQNTADSQLDRLKGRIYRNASRYRAPLDLMPEALRQLAIGLPVTSSAEEFRNQPNLKTGNPLIDTYAENDPSQPGEMGRGFTFVSKEESDAAATLQNEYIVNVLASDVIPLNRMVPDARMKGCDKLTYDHDLPTASVVIPFYDEWPSVLLRTVYSLVVRTPRHLLYEILLVDDHSTMLELGETLDQYVKDHFPRGLVRILRMPTREGLIRARMKGWEESKGDVVVFFDSHMEVNIDWLQPLLTEIKKDRTSVPMAELDYINYNTLQYEFYSDHTVRYGFDWRLIIFETFFRVDQIGSTPQSPRPGAMMVGAAFAIDRQYFGELGGYDTGMKVWGGENLEMAWRVWLCGGRLVHVPCSHVGHVARAQPYTFPEGRRHTEVLNYKRAIMVWMGDYKEFVLNYYTHMKNMDVGDLSERYALRNGLQCRNFTWYLDNVWPELSIYNRDVTAWGSVVNKQTGRCLDNHDHMFQTVADLYTDFCHHTLNSQGFSLTKTGLFRTTLHCVVFKDLVVGARPKLDDCFSDPPDFWSHTEKGAVVHLHSNLCLDEDPFGPVMRNCEPNRQSQIWSFTHNVNS